MTTANPFAQLRGMGYKRLVPIVPPDADVSPHSTLHKRLNTSQDARGKVPGVKGRDGLWRGVDWINLDMDDRDVERWFGMGAGAGVRTGAGLLAIDADTTDAALADTIRDRVIEHFGQLPCRIGNAPKALYLCRVTEDVPYKRVEFGAERVELLTDGRQFVAWGTHPKTRRGYKWTAPLVPFDSLPTFTPAQIDAFMADLRKTLPGASEIKTEGGAEAPANQDTLAGDPAHIERAVRATPNTSAQFGSREDFIHYGYAIKASLPNDPELAFDLFADWCARWADGENDPDVVRAEWARMKPPFRRGAQWLYDIAEQAGNFNAASVWLEPIPETEPSPFAIAEAKQVEDSTPPLTANPVSLDDLANLPPREWLYGNKILRKYVTFIASPGGVGKTAFTFGIALACASGKALLHDEPRGGRPLRVWLFNLEDDMIELRRRLAAAVHHYGLPAETLDNIRLNSGRDRGVKVLKTGQHGFVVQPDYEALVAAIRQDEIDIVVFDPFLRTHGVPENENEAQDEVMRLFAQIAERTRCGVVLVHHTKKGAIAGDMDSLRGGSTQGGSARAAFTLSPMQVEEANKLGIPEQERRLYVRVDDAKNNMAPPEAKAEWIKLASYKLGNISDAYPTGDSVQVASPWAPPSAWEGISADTESAVIARIGAGLENGERYSARAQDKDRWAGDVICEQMNRTPAQAKEILASWIESGRLRIEDYHSPNQYRSRKGLFAPTPDLFA